MKEKITIGFVMSFIFCFCLCLPVLVGIGFYKLVQQPIQPALSICISENCTEPEPALVPIKPIGPPVSASRWHIIRIPQTIGLAPGQSALPPKLANIPDLQGILYGNDVPLSLQDIVSANKGRDIVISFGDTWCGYCLEVVRIFGEFKSEYGDAVTLVAVIENDPGRLQILISRYSLNPSFIFVSNIENLDAYHQTALQGYRYQPIVIHINPEGSIDRILISSFGSVENLKGFIGIDLKRIF